MKKYLAGIGLFLGGSLLGSLTTGQVMAYQDHMNSALAALITAKDQLNMARDDKGGHRAGAIELTTDAIDQTKDGIRYADRHHDWDDH